MCTVLGFVVVQDHLKRRDSRARILVANYTSTLDRLAVELAFPCIMVLCFHALLIYVCHSDCLVLFVCFCFFESLLIRGQNLCPWS